MSRDRSGFTLFELLTTIVMMGIIMAFSYPKLQYVARTASLRGARRAMGTAVNVAKTSAITAGKCSYLKITSSAVKVFTTPCEGGTQIEIVSDRNFVTDYGTTVTLTKGSGSASSSDSLGFDPRGIPLNNSQSAVFTLTKAGVSYTVSVGNYGRVQ
jgi:prepilin-type N-terminal cleavage/methylation domain-containing protein